MVGHRDTASSWGSDILKSKPFMTSFPWAPPVLLRAMRGGLEGLLSDPRVLGLTRRLEGEALKCWKEPICMLAPAWVQGDHQPLTGNGTNHKATDPSDMGNRCLLPLSEEQGTC